MSREEGSPREGGSPREELYHHRGWYPVHMWMSTEPLGSLRCLALLDGGPRPCRENVPRKSVDKDTTPLFTRLDKEIRSESHPLRPHYAGDSKPSRRNKPYPQDQPRTPTLLTRTQPVPNEDSVPSQPKLSPFMMMAQPFLIRTQFLLTRIQPFLTRT